MNTLYEGEWFDVIEVDDWHGIKPAGINVVVLPFERDAGGLPRAIGVMYENNPLRPGAKSTTLITGDAEGEDPDILAAAMRELKEESGYSAGDPDRWYFLGFMTTSKLVAQSHPCFAVDVTGIERKKPEGDGTKHEATSEFKMLPTKEALATDDCFIPTLFLKMFTFIFGFGATNDNQESNNSTTTAKTENNEPLQSQGTQKDS